MIGSPLAPKLDLGVGPKGTVTCQRFTGVRRTWNQLCGSRFFVIHGCQHTGHDGGDHGLATLGEHIYQSMLLGYERVDAISLSVKIASDRLLL